MKRSRQEVTIDELAELFEEIIDLSGVRIEEKAVLGEDIPVTSKDMLRILSRIETRYRIKYEPRDLFGLKTLGDVLESIHRETP
jgi:acyl carrier protein